MEGVRGLEGVLGFVDPDWPVLLEEGTMEVVKPVGATGATTEAGGVTETGAALVVAPVFPLLLPVPPLLPSSAPSRPGQFPVGSLMLALSLVTSGPGFGNRRSKVSTVLQPLPALATNMSGRAEKATSGEPEPAVMVTLAQFMYISRLPIWLNQVQAKTALPAGVSAGTVNL